MNICKEDMLMLSTLGFVHKDKVEQAIFSAIT